MTTVGRAGGAAAMAGPGKGRRSWVAFGIGLALIGGAAWFLSGLQGVQRLGKPGVRLEARPVFDESGAVVATNAVYLPLDLPGFKSTNLPLSQAELNWLPKDTTFGRAGYQAPDGQFFQLSAVLMGADRTSIHKPEYCLAGMGFRIEQQAITAIPIGEPARYDLPVVKMVTTRETKLPDGTVVRNRALYVFWFVADSRLSADHNKRMLTSALDLVATGVMQRWAYVSCFAECDFGGEEQLFRRMSALIAAAVPRFQLATGDPLPLAAGEMKGGGN